MRWNGTGPDFYEMKWDRTGITWDQDEMGLNCELWDGIEPESTWDWDGMRLNSHSVEWDGTTISWDRNEMGGIRIE